MKKVFSVGMLAAGLLVSGAAAATDWSPVLCDVTDSCKGASPDLHALPGKYKSSVVTTTASKQDDVETKVFSLKDASAFGYPLLKVKAESGIDSGYRVTTLYFADTGFMALKAKMKQLDKQDNSGCGWTRKLDSNKKTLVFDSSC